MALNPEWNLEDTVRQVPTVIFSSSSESEGTVRVKKTESPRVSKNTEEKSTPSTPKKQVAPAAPVVATAVAVSKHRTGSPIRPSVTEQQQQQSAPVVEIAKSKRIYSTVGRILGDMKEQSQYQNSVKGTFHFI